MGTDAHAVEFMDLRKLTIQQLNAIDQLVLGCSDREAAEKVGVTRSTITRWKLYHPAFQAELNAQREAIWGTAKEKLRALLPEAVDVLAQAIRDPSYEGREKLALGLIKAVKVSENLDQEGSTVTEDIIDKAAYRPIESILHEPTELQIELWEWRTHARLNGMTVTELDVLREQEEEEAEERARRKAMRAAKKAAHQPKTSFDTTAQVMNAVNEYPHQVQVSVTEARIPNEAQIEDGKKSGGLCKCITPIRILTYDEYLEWVDRNRYYPPLVN